MILSSLVSKESGAIQFSPPLEGQGGGPSSRKEDLMDPVALSILPFALGQ